MKSELCSSFATSSSRHSRTCAPRWRRRRPQAARVATGSPACACAASWPPAQETPRAPSRSPPCRTPASAPRPPAARTRTPRRPPPRLPRARARSRTSCGHYSMSSSEKECGYATKPNSYAASSMTGIPSTPWRSRLRGRSPPPRAPSAWTRGGCAPSGTRCCCARRSWRRRRWARPRRSAAWTPRWTLPRARRASPRLTPRSSQRFSSRAILSNFRGSCSLPPFRIRYDLFINPRRSHSVLSVSAPMLVYAYVFRRMHSIIGLQK